MAISFKCTACRASYTVKDEFGGKRTKCKKCNAVISIPTRDSEDLDPPDIGFLDDVASAPREPAAVEAPPRRMPLRESAPPDDYPPSVVYSAPSVAVVRGPSTTTVRDIAPGYAPRARRSAGFDDDPQLNGLTVVMLAIFVLLTIGITVLAVSMEKHPSPGTVLVVVPLAVFIYYFGLLTPSTMAGFWMTCKIFSLPTPPKLYLRAAGVHLLIFVLMFGIQLGLGVVGLIIRGLGMPPVVAIPIVLIAFGLMIYAAFWSYNRYFGTGILQSLVAIVLSWIAGVALAIPMVLLLGGLVNLSGIADDTDGPDSNTQYTSNTSGSTTGKRSQTTVTPTPSQDPFDVESASLQQRITAQNRQLSMNQDQTREEYANSVRDLKGSLVSLERKYPGRDVKALQSDLDTFIKRVELLPTRGPGPEVFVEAPKPTDIWTTASTDRTREVSYLDFNIVPPAEFSYDVSSTEAKGYTWRAKLGASMTISTEAVGNPAQKQPWLTTQHILSVDGNPQNLFTIARREANKPTRGMIGDLAFWRVSDKYFRETEITLAALDGNRWVIIKLKADDEKHPDLPAMEAAARTLRRRSADETPIQPINSISLVEMLVSNNGKADEIIDQLKMRPDAESVVLERYAKLDDEPRKERLVRLIFAVATENSVPTLRTIAASKNSSNRAAARALIRKLDSKADIATLAINDLKAGDRDSFKSAMETLAAADVNEQSLPAVDEALVTAMEKREFFQSGDDLHPAVMKWAGPKVHAKMWSHLEVDDNTGDKKLAIKVLAATGEKKYCPAICRWIIKEPETVVMALTRMGPVAEIEVIKLLAEKNAGVRQNAVRILKQIGTNRCLPALGSVATNSRDPLGQALAKEAMAEVRERNKSATTAPTP